MVPVYQCTNRKRSPDWGRFKKYLIAIKEIIDWTSEVAGASVGLSEYDAEVWPSAECGVIGNQGHAELLGAYAVRLGGSTIFVFVPFAALSIQVCSRSKSAETR
jgi:hypothetical protein